MNKNMRIAMIAPDKCTEKGIAIYSNTLSEYIKKTGIDIDNLSYNLGSYFSLLKLIPKLNAYDIIHIQHEYGLFGKITGEFFIPLIIILGLFTRKKLVITMHSIYSKKHKPSSRYSWLSKIRRIFFFFHNKLINTFSVRIIMHTDSLARLLTKDYRVDKSKIVVIPQGVREDAIRFKKGLAKKKLGVLGNVYLVMGNMGKLKGTDIIIGLARKIKKTILIAGHSNFKSNMRYIKNIEEYIKNNNLGGIVKLDKTEMDSMNKKWWLYFSAADLVVLPYRQMITSGIFSDAMASRKPVVGANKQYLREVFSKYDCLKIAENENDYPKIIREAMKPKNYKKMVKECERYARENSLGNIAKKYKILYNSILNE